MPKGFIIDVRMGSKYASDTGLIYCPRFIYVIHFFVVIPSDDPYWLEDPLKRDPVPSYTRRFIEQKFNPFDCPP